jgi:hypothetical protein
MSHTTPDISLHSTAARIGDHEINMLEPGAAAALRGILGPTTSSHAFPGTTRTVELLRGGAMLLTDNKGHDLLSLMICFDAQDSSLYRAFPEVPVYAGTVDCAGHRFFGGESEAAVKKIAGIYGFGGVLKLDVGELHVGFHFKKRKNRFGEPTGEPALVLIVAEWGGLPALRGGPERSAPGSDPR